MTTIETLEQAETLPVGTVLRLTSGQIYARIDTADDGADWQTIGDTYCWGAVEMLNEHPGPATVLHDPTQPAPAGVIDREKLDRKIKKLERKLERVNEDIRRHAGRNLPFELEREDKR